MCDCIAQLKTAAAQELEQADRAARQPGTDARRRERSHRARFRAYGWAAGELKRRAGTPS